MQQAFYKPNASFSLINLEISKTQKVKDTSKNDASEMMKKKQKVENTSEKDTTSFPQAKCKTQYK